MAALFMDGVPLEGSRNVVEPAPHHTLLILARKAGGPGGPLPAKHRARIDRAFALDPQAWEEARRAGADVGCPAVARASRVALSRQQRGDHVASPASTASQDLRGCPLAQALGVALRLLDPRDGFDVFDLADLRAGLVEIANIAASIPARMAERQARRAAGLSCSVTACGI